MADIVNYRLSTIDYRPHVLLLSRTARRPPAESNAPPPIAQDHFRKSRRPMSLLFVVRMVSSQDGPATVRRVAFDPNPSLPHLCIRFKRWLSACGLIPSCSAATF